MSNIPLKKCQVTSCDRIAILTTSWHKLDGTLIEEAFCQDHLPKGRFASNQVLN